MKTLLFAFAIFALLIPAFAQDRAEIPFQVVARGQNSGEANQTLKVFRTERALEEFAKDKGQDISKRLIKDVDWDKEQIVVVFAGTQNSGGFGIDVKRILNVDVQRLVVEAKVSRPAAGSVNTQAMTSPYIVIKMTRQVAVIKAKFLDN